MIFQCANDYNIALFCVQLFFCVVPIGKKLSITPFSGDYRKLILLCRASISLSLKFFRKLYTIISFYNATAHGP